MFSVFGIPEYLIGGYMLDGYMLDGWWMGGWVLQLLCCYVVMVIVDGF